MAFALTVSYERRTFRLALKRPVAVAKVKKTLVKAHLRDVGAEDLVLRGDGGDALDDGALLSADAHLVASVGGRAAPSAAPPSAAPPLAPRPAQPPTKRPTAAKPASKHNSFAAFRAARESAGDGPRRAPAPAPPPPPPPPPPPADAPFDRYYRVAHVFVFVRSAPRGDGDVVGRKNEDGLFRARAAGDDNWVEVDPRDLDEGKAPGFMMVHGASVGLGPLLERLEFPAFVDAVRKAKEKADAEKARVEGVVEQTFQAVLAQERQRGPVDAARAAQLREEVRKAVLQRYIATQMTDQHHRSTRHIGGADAATAACAESDAFVRDEDLVARLLSDGYAVVDGFLDPAACVAARREAETLDGRGLLEQTIQAMADTRDDRIKWVTSDGLRDWGCPVLARVAAFQRGLAAAINGTGRWRETLTVPESSMLACYGAGGRYKYHRDNSWHDGSPTNARALTAIAYLNPGWDVGRDGGALNIYDENEHTDNADRRTTAAVVAPEAGRVVVFDSFRGHEVCRAKRDRFALTFWVYADRKK